tara:strand:+ start:310 stop:1821 length:1512 start_codon:yes stop_codon:yes gene_type:complete
MAGEINFGILNQNLPAEIAGSYYRGQEQQQQNALAKQQLSQAQMSTQVSGMQLEKMKREEAGLLQMQRTIAAQGGPTNVKVAAQAMIDSGDPEHMKTGAALMQTIMRSEDRRRIMGMGMGGPTAAPAAGGGGMSEPYAGYNAAIGAPAGPAANEPYTGYNAAIGAPTENALAPMAAQPPVANALAPANAARAQQIAILRRQKNELLAIGDVASANSLEKDIELLSKEPVLHVVNGALVGANGVPVYTAPAASDKVPEADLMARLGYPLTPEGYAAFNQAKQRQERLRSKEEEDQAIRIALASRPPAQPRAEPALRTQQVTMSDGTLGIMNMDTGAVTPATLGGAAVKGKPTAFAEKQAAAKVQLQKDLTFAITEIGDAIKEGGLIDQSTGSGAGRLADISMGFVGQATPGAIAIGKLQPIADLPLKLVPRFEGPQSNADLKTYQQASAQLADPTLPRAIRKAAGATIVRLMTERQGQFATKDMAPTVENAAKGNWGTAEVVKQ